MRSCALFISAVHLIHYHIQSVVYHHPALFSRFALAIDYLPSWQCFWLEQSYLDAVPWRHEVLCSTTGIWLIDKVSDCIASKIGKKRKRKRKANNPDSVHRYGILIEIWGWFLPLNPTQTWPHLICLTHPSSRIRNCEAGSYSILHSDRVHFHWWQDSSFYFRAKMGQRFWLFTMSFFMQLSPIISRWAKPGFLAPVSLFGWLGYKLWHVAVTWAEDWLTYDRLLPCTVDTLVPLYASPRNACWWSRQIPAGWNALFLRITAQAGLQRAEVQTDTEYILQDSVQNDKSRRPIK